MAGQPHGFGFNMDQNQGYPPYGANQGPGYPPTGQGDPGYPPAGQGGAGYPQGGPGYPQQGSGMLGGPGYPSRGGPGYPQGLPTGQPGVPGYPPQGHGGPGYPQSGPGYPSSAHTGLGYPPTGAGAPGYPPSGPPSQPGYPGQPQQQPYVPYSAGAPPPAPHSGYPSQNPPYGQPQQQGYGNQGYPQGPPHGQPSNTGYGSSPYPPATNFGQAPGYPPQGQSLTQHGNLGTGPFGGQSMGSNMTGHIPPSTPSLKPRPGFNAQSDAEILRKAMKGFGTNERDVIQVICGRTNQERQQINQAFRTMYGKDLIKDLKSELSGDFEDLIVALMEPSAIYDAKQLRKAMEGLGTKESVLIEIMCSRTNAEIQAIKLSYKQLYGRDLEHELIGESSGHFQRLLRSLCAGGRDESNRIDLQRASQDAQKLYRAGVGRLGTDESQFNAILAAQNYAQLRIVLDEYQKLTRHSIEQAIDSEFSGDIRDGLLAMVKCIKNKPAYFAELVYNSLKGFGTRDTDLIRVLVTRAEIDLRDIRNEFQRMYKTPLEKAITGDCSGHYKEGLIALVKGNY